MHYCPILKLKKEKLNSLLWQWSINAWITCLQCPAPKCLPLLASNLSSQRQISAWRRGVEAEKKKLAAAYTRGDLSLWFTGYILFSLARHVGKLGERGRAASEKKKSTGVIADFYRELVQALRSFIYLSLPQRPEYLQEDGKKRSHLFIIQS